MGCKFEWVDEQHFIMNMVVESPWTWQELMDQSAAAFSTLRVHGKPCATQIDVSGIGFLPKGNVLRYLTEIEKLVPDNMFASAMIGAPYMVTVFMDMMMHMRPRAQRVTFFAKTFEEAYSKIMGRYAKLENTSKSAS